MNRFVTPVFSQREKKEGTFGGLRVANIFPKVVQSEMFKRWGAQMI